MIKHFSIEHNILDAKPVAHSQKIISEMFKKISSTKSKNSTNKSNAEQKYLLSRQLALMCAIDFEPFAVAERKGFQQFYKWNQITNLPTAQNLSDTALVDIDAFFKKKTIEVLDDCTHIGMILDCWTDALLLFFVLTSPKKRNYFITRIRL